MCRISGIVSDSIPNEEIHRLVGLMNGSMVHGGPDDEGILIDEQAGLCLGNRRLSILDLSPSGHLPMKDDLDEIYIAYNGEIYNFLELKEVLHKKGHEFSTRTDTEVILKSYKEWGISCFDKFNGIFAAAIYDKERKKLYLARNKNAVKPLYWYQDNEKVIFASETRAFGALPFYFKENPDWKSYFLAFGYIPNPYTTYKDVLMLEKGGLLTIDLANHTTTKGFIGNCEVKKSVFSKSEAVDLIRNSLKNSVERQMVSDAPIGVFLSGGIDSSILALLASDTQHENLTTLSIVFENGQFSEKKYQDIIVSKLKNKHKSFLLTQDIFVENILDILAAYDQPSTDGINTYFISKYAKEAGLKVVLSGIGADEYFGGYPSFKNKSLHTFLADIPHFMFKLFKFAQEFKFKKLEYLQINDQIGQYLMNRGNFSPSVICKILDIPPDNFYHSLTKLYIKDHVKGLGHFSETSWMESNLYMKNQLLKDTDYMGMWNSLEIRVPFLDDFFLKDIATIDTSLFLDDGRNKGLLISAFEDILPREIWDRPKKGFTLPFQDWMKQREFIDEMIHYRNPYVKKLANLFDKDKMEWSRFWSLYVLNSFEKKRLKYRYTDLETRVLAV